MLFPVAALVAHQSTFGTLADALAASAWNAESRGPLLIIGADKVTVYTLKRERNPRPGDVNAMYTESGISPEDRIPFPPQLGALEAATAFDRQILRVGSVSVVAPLYQPVFLPDNTQDSRSALLALLGSLDGAQLRKFASPSGLGAEDLDPRQRAYLDRYLTRPLAILSEGKLKALSETQRAQTHLHATRRTEVHILDRAQGTERRAEKRLPEDSLPQLAPTSFLRQLPPPPVPERPANRLKPGHLNFASDVLQKPVSLEGVTTVGELMARCQKATGIELHADFFFRDQSTVVRSAGQSAQAGDLLKACCWALHATFRQVGPAFVLTPELEGLGALSARRELASIQKSTEEGEAILRLRSQPWKPFLTFASDDLLAQEASLRQQYEKAAPYNEGTNAYSGLVFPLDRSAALKQRAHAFLDREQAQQEEGMRIRAQISAELVAQGRKPIPEDPPAPAFTPELARLEATDQLELLVPDLGTVSVRDRLDFPELGPPPPLLETSVPLSLTGKRGQGTVVLAAPKTAAEAQKLVEAAARQGIRTVWIEGDRDLAPLDAALAVGKKVGMAVGAALPLLRSDDPTLPSPVQDRTLFGEDTVTWLKRIQGVNRGERLFAYSQASWLLPDAPETRARLVRRLDALAMRPNLVGVICTNCRIPGYDNPDADLGPDRAGNGFGYTLDRRLAFLREQSRDPIDCPFYGSAQYGVSLMRPFNQVRREAQQRFLNDAYQQIRTRLPALPIYASPNFTGWFGLWESAERFPEARTHTINAADWVEYSRQAHERSRIALHCILYRPGMYEKQRAFSAWTYPRLGDVPQALAVTVKETLLYQEKEKADWDGLVLDLRFVSGEKAAELLGGIVVQK